MMEVALLASGEGWHYSRLAEAFSFLGARVFRVPITRLRGRLQGHKEVLSSQGLDLCHMDAVMVRTIPPGSLEQIIFRMDALRRLQDGGVAVFNPAPAIECTVDKYLTSALLLEAGVPVPFTITVESFRDAMDAFAELEGDVVVKPIFGSLGRGMLRVDNVDLAHRVFRTLEMTRSVFYLQRFVPHRHQDLRLLVVDDEVLASMARVGPGWRTNLSQGALPRRVQPTPGQQELALRAARAVGAFYAGVDILESLEGEVLVLEVNGIPGWEGLQQVTDINIAYEIALRVARKTGLDGETHL